jgi:hypothetical protein
MPITFQGNPNTNELVLDFDYSSAVAGATGGSGSWSYTLPTNARTLSIICVSAGAGGGSGRCGAAGTNRFGGSGGAGGTVTVIQSIPVSQLPSLNLSITVGPGGAGGAAQLTSDTNGNDGQFVTVDSAVSSSTTTICRASSQSTQTNGRGGTSTNSPVGVFPAGFTGTFTYQQGNAGSNTTLGTSVGTSMIPTAGAGGGGVNTSNIFSRGQVFGTPNSAGGCWGGAPHGGNPANGVDGATGIDPVIVPHIPVGSGGTGGNGGASVQGGAGRNGVRGGGGGGGGGGTNGLGSGAGGKGGDGFVRIVVTF